MEKQLYVNALLFASNMHNIVLKLKFEFKKSSS